MSRILVADDDLAVTQVVCQSLEEAGYRTIPAQDGEEALRLFFEERPDLLVLDIKMPRLDGNKVAARVREVSLAPIIILSGRDSESDKVLSLGIGADDYVTKPVGRRELVARVQAALRRAGMRGRRAEMGVFDDGFLRVDFARHEASVYGRPIDLTPIEFRILAALLSHEGRTITREELLTEVWGSAHDSPDAVKWHVSRLRRKLGDSPQAWKALRNVRGIGYRYEAATAARSYSVASARAPSGDQGLVSLPGHNGATRFSAASV